MKRTTRLLVFALFLLAFPVSAQRLQSVLWEVSGHGLQHPSYLFGTVHTFPPSLLDKFPVKQYMRQAQFGVFETYGKPITPAQPKKNSLPERPQPPLDSLFSKRDYALVDSFFTASLLGSIKPHNTDADLGGMLYAVSMLKKNSTADPVGLDASIAEEMQRLEKPIFYLDAPDDPDRRDFETKYMQLAGLLVALIKDKTGQLENHLTGDTRMQKNYVTKLAATMQLNEAATGNLKKLTVHRNLLWVPQLEQKMQEGSCFVAVGLNHLGFKTGLIVLLRQRGYKLRPVKLPASPQPAAPGTASRLPPAGRSQQ